MPKRVAAVYALGWLCQHCAYVGGTLDVVRRRAGHFRRMRLGRHRNVGVRDMFRCYGAPEWAVLEVVAEYRESAPIDLRERLAEAETRWLHHAAERLGPGLLNGKLWAGPTDYKPGRDPAAGQRSSAGMGHVRASQQGGQVPSNAGTPASTHCTEEQGGDLLAVGPWRGPFRPGVAVGRRGPLART